MWRNAARVHRNVPLSVTSTHDVPLVIGHVDDRSRATEPGVVDQHVDSAVLVDRAVDQRLHLLLSGDVADHREWGSSGELAELIGGLTEAALVVVADDDARALLARRVARSRTRSPSRRRP